MADNTVSLITFFSPPTPLLRSSKEAYQIAVQAQQQADRGAQQAIDLYFKRKQEMSPDSRLGNFLDLYA